MAALGLSTTRLAHMRARVLDLMPDTYNLQQPVRTVDDAGGWIDDIVLVEYNDSVDIPCRIDPTRQYRQGDVFEQEIVISDFIITVPYDAPLVEDHIIECNETEYEIKKLMDTHSWNAVKRAFIVKLN